MSQSRRVFGLMVVVTAAIISCGCSQQKKVDAVHAGHARPIFADSELAAKSEYQGINGITIPDVSQADLPGRYYRGDGLGYNLTLVLEEDGTFDGTWRGCLGVYGTSQGTWSLVGKHIILASTVETDMMQGHLSSLDVLLHEGEIILVPSDDNEFFIDDGPSRFSCFNRRP